MLQELGLNEKIQFANRKAVGGGGKRELVVKAPSKKTAEERQLMETRPLYEGVERIKMDARSTWVRKNPKFSMSSATSLVSQILTRGNTAISWFQDTCCLLLNTTTRKILCSFSLTMSEKKKTAMIDSTQGKSTFLYPKTRFQLQCFFCWVVVGIRNAHSRRMRTSRLWWSWMRSEAGRWNL